MSSDFVYLLWKIVCLQIVWSTKEPVPIAILDILSCFAICIIRMDTNFEIGVDRDVIRKSFSLFH